MWAINRRSITLCVLSMVIVAGKVSCFDGEERNGVVNLKERSIKNVQEEEEPVDFDEEVDIDYSNDIDYGFVEDRKDSLPAAPETYGILDEEEEEEVYRKKREIKSEEDRNQRRMRDPYGRYRLSVGKTLMYSGVGESDSGMEDKEGDEMTSSKSTSVGAPLFLTEYIDSGRIDEGRKKAAVKPFAGKVKSYAGIITVNKQFNSSTFFWFFESEIKPDEAPLLVWLQGGPGASSLYGLFVENGPYAINTKGKIVKRKTYWSQKFNVVFIDNPVGTGFSFTNPDGYARNQTVVGRDLYSFISQFLTLFPKLRHNDFYITGESYAGKYIPAFAHRIHAENIRKPVEERVNLKGLFIGNGWSDPPHMLNYGDYLYELGLIDVRGRGAMKKLEKNAIRKIKQKKWNQANYFLSKMIGDEGTLYFKYTGLTSYYNYYDVTSGTWSEHHDRFINSTAFRRAVHVGSLPYTEGGLVYANLQEDVLKTVIYWVRDLLDHYPIVFYNGQLDIICAYPLTENALRNMRWKGSGEYRKAERKIYRVDGQVAGYYKRAGNLTEILVRDAGHMVPTDQPVWSLQMLVDHIYGTGGLA